MRGTVRGEDRLRRGGSGAERGGRSPECGVVCACWPARGLLFWHCSPQARLGGGGVAGRGLRGQCSPAARTAAEPSGNEDEKVQSQKQSERPRTPPAKAITWRDSAAVLAAG